MMAVQLDGTDQGAAGETLERSRRRRKFWIIGGLAGIGFVAGFMAGFTQPHKVFDPSLSWSPELTLGLAVAWLVAVIGGGLLYARHTDEFEQAWRYKGVAAGACAYVILYPVWLLLWKGGVAPEPMHFVIFLAFMAVTLVASLFYRVR